MALVIDAERVRVMLLLLSRPTRPTKRINESPTAFKTRIQQWATDVETALTSIETTDYVTDDNT